MTKDGKSLTDEEIWGEAQKPISQPPASTKPALFGFDICDKCGEEIPREEGLKELCPKCKARIRNPI